MMKQRPRCSPGVMSPISVSRSVLADQALRRGLDADETLLPPLVPPAAALVVFLPLTLIAVRIHQRALVGQPCIPVDALPRRDRILEQPRSPRGAGERVSPRND